MLNISNFQKQIKIIKKNTKSESSTSAPGGNLVDGLPPAPSLVGPNVDFGNGMFALAGAHAGP